MILKHELIICSVLLLPFVDMQAWKMDVDHKYDYTVLYTKHLFDDCENQCISALGRGVNIATMNSKLLNDPFVKNIIKTLIVWVKCNDSTTCKDSSANYYVQNGKPVISTYKNAILRCMCQKLSENYDNKTKASSSEALVTSNSSHQTSTKSVNNTNSNSQESNWIYSGGVHYFLNRNKTTHEQAVRECNNIHGTLVICNHPTILNVLVGILSLNGMYWIDGRQDDKCLSANVVDRVEITISNCKLVKQSICSRVTDPDAVKGEPLFLDLIRNMTVDVKDTSKRERTLISVEDKRLSARTVGCTLGVACILFVTFLLVFADLQSVHMKSRQNKAPVSKKESVA